MKLTNRILILMGTIFWGIFIYWYSGSFISFSIVLLGIVYVIIGGKQHAWVFGCSNALCILD